MSADSKERCESVLRNDKKNSAQSVSAIAVESVAGLDGNGTSRRRLFHRKLGKAVKIVRI